MWFDGEGLEHRGVFQPVDSRMVQVMQCSACLQPMASILTSCGADAKPELAKQTCLTTPQPTEIIFLLGSEALD